jgi:hypothetical protein
MGYRLTSCTDEFNVYETSSDLSVYVGKVISIEEHEGCFTVTEVVVSLTPEEINVKDCFESCDDCTKIVFRLRDCLGNYPDFYSKDGTLESLVGKVVRSQYYKNSCFHVTEVQTSESQNIKPIFPFEGDFNTCFDCYPKDSPKPFIGNILCNLEKIESVKCSFVDLLYQQVMEKRFGVKNCCPIDGTEVSIQNEVLNHDLILDPDPDLPEPFVEYCCIPQKLPCGTHQTPCCGGVILDTSLYDVCECTASPDSPHDCHTYSIGVNEEDIALAIGNESEDLNGKVFFGYFKCKETTPTFIQYTSEAAAQDYCVLGIPLFGYFVEDVWVDIALTRGSICEPEENTCCHE